MRKINKTNKPLHETIVKAFQKNNDMLAVNRMIKLINKEKKEGK